jgi:hypothetical protein
VAKFDYKGIIAVRFPHPTERREIEVQIDTENGNADAVFISVNAVENILAPYYAKKDPEDAKRLLNEVSKQEQNGVCFVYHKFTCGRIVPPIDWGAKSPTVIRVRDKPPAR